MDEKIILIIILGVWITLGSINLGQKEINKSSYAVLLIAYICGLVCDIVK